MSHIRSQAISEEEEEEEEAVTYLLDIPEKIFKLHIKSCSCGFRAFCQAPMRAAIPVHRRDNMMIRDVDIYNKAERAAHNVWVVNIIRVLMPDADIWTLRMYVKWLKIPDLPEPGATDRSWYDQLHRGVNGWMNINACHSLSATLPYIGLFTIVGGAILHKATYLFHTNSKTYHYGAYPGSVLLDLVEPSNYIGFSQAQLSLLPTRLADEERLQSAVRDFIRNIRARAGDGRKAAWSFTHDHSPPKDYIFPFSYSICNNHERLAKLPR